jgi:cation transport protein ChaC
MRSVHWRGTPEAPGLVLALDAAPGAACTGLALRVAPGAEAATLAGLRDRELVSYAYEECRLTAATAQGPVEALAYVVSRGHAQYCAGLTDEEQARIIATAAGRRGTNRDYLYATVAHLAELGLADPELDRLAARVRALAAG